MGQKRTPENPHASQRMKRAAITDNIANAGTPNYKAKDVTFEGQTRTGGAEPDFAEKEASKIKRPKYLKSQYIALIPGRKGTNMSNIRDQILELFLHLTAEQQESAVDFVQSMLAAGQEGAAADQE